jgi:hypothetical protein
MLLRCVIAVQLLATALGKATVGNHGISALDCELNNVLVNPSVFGAYLDFAGNTTLTLTVDGATTPLTSGLAGDAVFPACNLAGAASQGGGQTLNVTYYAFAPISPVSADPGFLPVLIGLVNITNVDAADHSVAVALDFFCPPGSGYCKNSATMASLAGRAVSSSSAAAAGSATAAGPVLPVMNSSVSMLIGAWLEPGSPGTGWTRAACSGAMRDAANASLCAGFGVASLAPGQWLAGAVVLGHWEAAGPYVATYGIHSLADLFAYASTNAGALAAAHAAFVDALPTAGDAHMTQSVRWYVQVRGCKKDIHVFTTQRIRQAFQASVLLTKGVLNQTITMG